MKKYICIHGHFYQPPRENPWLEAIELQESAYPYHDWNERITDECYARNIASRILDGNKKIVEIVNNYSRMSFNFGPTLLSWLEKKDPETYKTILETDAVSQNRFSGHGSALAQVYNHMIMPLANTRDKRTQVIWGIKDFEYRFRRKPEGMWLAETAVDVESLDIMAHEGIKFTILAPHQAQKIRRIGMEDDPWTTVDERSIDTRRPYLCRLPSGRTISIFFYQGPTSRAIAFEGLLRNGEHFARRLLGNFDSGASEVQLVSIATDGESYGHHHKFGDMALAYCFHFLESQKLANITIYGEYLEKFPPQYEVMIHENSSWSCAHGVERWRSNCGCHIGQGPWQQQWRDPLRRALDHLRDRVAPIYEREMSIFTIDPWLIRDAYIDVILNRERKNIDHFLSQNMVGNLPEQEKVRLLKLLEIQRNALLMYTSCGWFFDEISGTEAVQILHYAARVIQLVKDVTGEDLEKDFLEILQEAKSNVPEYKTGASVYQILVKPSIVDLVRVVAHYAVSSLFEEYPKDFGIYCYSIKNKHYDRKIVGHLRYAMGQGWVQSEITWERQPCSFVVFYFGNHHLMGAVKEEIDEKVFSVIGKEFLDAFFKNDMSGMVSLMNKYFPHRYTLSHLFRDEQLKILNEVLQSAMVEIETSFRHIHEHYYPLMNVKRDLRIPWPRPFSMVMEFILNRELCDVLEKHPLNMERFQEIVEDMSRLSVEGDRARLNFLATQKINELMLSYVVNPEDTALIETMEKLLNNLANLHIYPDLWKVQNIYFSLNQKLPHRPTDHFERLGQLLEIRLR
ncbi:MAG: DUF3536 domain-containing protein [Candidatus Omnitrophica bacterium]|nr:DUF3536 domain-containing protein [Candidatus Omnitrophota bacterium]